MQNILILYGSQTGTAEFLAQELERILKQKNVQSTVSSIDGFQIQELPNQKCVLFIVSTTGQGDPPDNMKKFWQFLLIKDLQSDSLSNLNFSVFGLGDSSYQKYNAMARKLHQRLLQLGAFSFCERGLGDDQDKLGYFDAFHSWTTRVCQSLSQNFFPENQKLMSDYDLNVLLDPVYDIQILNEPLLETYDIYKNTIKLVTLENQLMTPVDYEFETRRLLFESDNWNYMPGDILEIYPYNDEQLCKNLIDRFKLDSSQFVILKNIKSSDFQFENPIQVWDLFTKYLNVSWYPNKYFMRLMSQFTDDQVHKEKLIELSGYSIEGIKDYYEYVVREKRNVYEVLFDFQSVNLPLNYFIEAVGFQKSRQYSISSSSKVSPGQIELTVGIVKYRTPFKRKLTGICSLTLQKLQPSNAIHGRIQKGILTQIKEYNIILVACGTGIAPIMSILREHQNDKNILLFFGFKHSNQDFYYKDILQNLHQQNKIQLITAISREQSHKVYVQHKIKQHGQKVYDLIQTQNCLIYVCGTSKYMPQQVEQVLAQNIIRVHVIYQNVMFIKFERPNSKVKYGIGKRLITNDKIYRHIIIQHIQFNSKNFQIIQINYFFIKLYRIQFSLSLFIMVFIQIILY